ncbi:hypothetical protein N0V95_002703 [Ascochyta clinopodiicola]|nr:hypothetical protein N0V95_002703 [Ascochyta clinopodiicola]
MNATRVVLAWIAAHPYQTAFQVVNGVIICTPAAATVPLLAALGFGAAGPAADIAQPLTDFTQIGHNTYLWTSASYTAPSSPFLLIFAWNAAAARHIAKYTTTYQRLFPSSRFLLIRCYTSDMFTSSARTAALLSPALEVTHAHVSAGGESDEGPMDEELCCDFCGAAKDAVLEVVWGRAGAFAAGVHVFG